MGAQALVVSGGRQAHGVCAGRCERADVRGRGAFPPLKSSPHDIIPCPPPPPPCTALCLNMSL